MNVGSAFTAAVLDVILAPATPWPATRIGQEKMIFKNDEMLVRPNTGMLTQPGSCIGLPVVCAPAGEPTLTTPRANRAATWRNWR